jgi:hypothetical protein
MNCLRGVLFSSVYDVVSAFGKMRLRKKWHEWRERNTVCEVLPGKYEDKARFGYLGL